MADVENVHSVVVRARSEFRTEGNLPGTDGLGLATFGVGCHFYSSPIGKCSY